MTFDGLVIGNETSTLLIDDSAGVAGAAEALVVPTLAFPASLLCNPLIF